MHVCALDFLKYHFTAKTLRFYSISFHLVYSPNLTSVGINYNILNMFAEME